MTDSSRISRDARESGDVGEPSDLGRRPDQLARTLKADLDEAQKGSDMGSDTRAGSLRGGSASGSERDPDQETINRDLAQQGRDLGAPPAAKPDKTVRNTGRDAIDASGRPREGQGDDVDAATG
jgi:hypothetical protein